MDFSIPESLKITKTIRFRSAMDNRALANKRELYRGNPERDFSSLNLIFIK